MPKEYIRSKHEDDRKIGLALSVGWSKDAEHVQIATLAFDEQVLAPTPEGNGWFVQLDRDGINRTIRALRKARDQAYGSDA